MNSPPRLPGSCHVPDLPQRLDPLHGVGHHRALHLRGPPHPLVCLALLLLTLLTRFRNLSSAVYIVPVIIFTLLWNLTRFAELTTCYTERNVTTPWTGAEGLVPRTVLVPQVCPTALRKSLSYTRDYILIANFLVMALLPFILLAVLNYRLYRTIRVSPALTIISLVATGVGIKEPEDHCSTEEGPEDCLPPHPRGHRLCEL